MLSLLFSTELKELDSLIEVGMFSLDRLKGINVFVTVADAGSFAGAAKKLNLTNSAVSKNVSRLESRLNKKLFHRTTRSLSLTEAGVLYYRSCQAVLAELEEVELAIIAEDSEPQGRVRIDLPASYGRLHVLPLLLDFAAKHPKLQPHISFSDHFIDPIQEGIDIVVRIGGPDTWPAMLGHRFIGSQQLVFCAAPSYLAIFGTPQSAQDLDNHQCVVYGQGDGMVSPWYFRGTQAGDMERRVPPARIAVGDGEGEMMAVIHGQGIAQLPLWLVQDNLDQGVLIEVLPELATDGLPMNLVWLKSRESQPKVRALLALLTEHLTPSGHSNSLCCE